MFYDSGLLPDLAPLETHWGKVLDEVNGLDNKGYLAWPEKALYGEKGWDVFGLHAFGQRMDENCERCPQTAQLVEAIPGMATAGFSRLAPQTHIQPHEGYAGYAGHFLRAHLGLVIPEDCALRVGDETRGWQEGKVMVFDDSFEHEAWNRSDKERIVLLIDFKNPFREANAPGPTLTQEVTAMLKSEGLT